MKRAVPRSIVCAAIYFAILAIAAPAFAQTSTAPTTTTKSVPATKPAARAVKHAVRGAKPARWAPRRYYYSRWRPYSRWSWRPGWHKPVAAAKYGYKAAVKPAAKTASAVLAKPAVAATKTAHSTAWSAPHTASEYAAKPAAWAKTAAKAAAPAKTKAQAMPAAGTKAATTAHPTAKPVAAKSPAIRAAPAAAAIVKKTAQAPETLTRDANNGMLASSADSTIAGGDRNDLPQQAARMAGVTALVILVIVGGTFLLRKYNLVPVSETGASLTSAQSAKSNANKGFAAAFLPAIGNMSASKGQPPKTTSPAQDLSDAMIGNGGLQIVGGQPLPGSGTIVYLVRIEDHLVLLGASYAGGVRLLAEWEKDDQPETETEKARFDSFLREQGVAAEPVRDEEEEHTFATIRARLNSTAERLAGLRQEFGG